MSENIVTEPVVPNLASESVRNFAVPVPPAPKKSPILLFIALVLLSLVSVLAIYLFLQVRTLTLEQTAPSPTPTPVASADPMADWQTYHDLKNNFSFRYPKDWEQFESDSQSILKLTKSISRQDIVFEKCDTSNDCSPSASIELTIKDISKDYDYNLSPCKIFGECLLAERTESITNGDVKITMDYMRKDAIYPIYSYVNISNKSAIRVKSYLPSTKNCTGTRNGRDCGEQEDSDNLKIIGKEIISILSTLKFTD